MSSHNLMKPHHPADDSLDLRLRHSLKNWANHKDPPKDGRDRLLAAAQREKSTRRHRPVRFNFAWFFRLQENSRSIDIRPITGYTLENIYSLQVNMAIL